MNEKAELIWNMANIANHFNDEDLVDIFLNWGIETKEDAKDMVEYFDDIAYDFAYCMKNTTASGLKNWLYV